MYSNNTYSITTTNETSLQAVNLSQRIQTAVQIVLKPPAPQFLVRQHHTNVSGFAISAINKYMLRSKYP